MNFKRLLITTVFAISQVAIVLPASAAEVVQSNKGQGANANVVSGQVTEVLKPILNQNEVSEEQTQVPTQSGADENGSPSNELPGSDDNTPPPSIEDTNTDTDSSEGDVNTGTPSTTEDASKGTTTPSTQTDGTVAQSNLGQLTLMMNSNKMYQNGKEYLATQPMTVKNGVSYVAARSLVDRVGLKLFYDSKTKETVITRGADEIRFKIDSDMYKVNGVAKKMKGKSYAQKNVFMVPLTSITQALNIPYTVDSKAKKVVLTLSTKPIAQFSVQQTEIVAGETEVNYSTKSSSPTGSKIVEEQWDGRQDIFDTPGKYTVSYRVRDAAGQWSDTFTLTITVVKPHVPPVANFTTTKNTYKMGEFITYTDLSTDEDNSIVDAVWENNKRAFFSPGTVTVRLKVVNKYGLSSTVEKQLTITDEVLYPEDDFNQLFTPVGEKYYFNGAAVPSWSKINYTFDSEPTTLVRSNSPETVYSEGIVYRETTVGSTRFMIHHKNALTKDVKMYVIATNTNKEVATLTVEDTGFAGPNIYANATGKLSVQRYFESIRTGSSYSKISFAPGESKIVLTELNALKMKPQQVISLFADVSSDAPIQYDIIMIDANKDPMKTLPTLSIHERDGVHNRGTFEYATRIINHDGVVGTEPSRLVLGDNNSDPFQLGMDSPNGVEERNAGNFGVLYKIKLQIAPNTLVTFNPRGGSYTGVILVNGSMVNIPNTGKLMPPNETGVVYRTGNREESVEFLFTAAPGSSLSVNLLFEPLPALKF